MRAVPEWALHDGIDEHEDCDESPCEACALVEARTPDACVDHPDYREEWKP